MRKEVLSPCTIVRVQTWNSEAGVPSAVEELLSVAWPQKPGFVASARAHIICVGPTDWLVLTTESDATGWLDELASVFGNSEFRATNVSNALARIEIAGLEVRDLLAKGCSLDLHSPVFPYGCAARTRFAGMPVIVRCVGTSKFELVVTQSYADFLLSWFADAELEFSKDAT